MARTPIAQGTGGWMHSMRTGFRSWADLSVTAIETALTTDDDADSTADHYGLADRMRETVAKIASL